MVAGGAIAICVIQWFRILSPRLVTGRLACAGAALVTVIALWTLGAFALFLGHKGLRPWAGAVDIFGIQAVAGGVSLLLPRDPTVLTPRSLRSNRLRRAVRPRAALLGLLGLAVLVAGCLLVIASMHLATSRRSLSPAFAAFWLGMGLMLSAPFWAIRSGRVGSPVSRVTFVAVVSMILYAPLIIRAPRRPLMYDELGHWGETQQLLSSGHLFQADPIVAVGPKFPGLEVAAGLASKLSGVDVYHVGMAIVLLAHIAALVGISVLARRVVHYPNADVVAMVIYAFNPSFLRIDAWFSYESLALPLGIWFLACMIEFGFRHNPTWLVVGAMSLGALVITHHLTSYAFSGLLLVCGLFSIRRNHRIGLDYRPLLAAAAVAAGLEVGWAVWVNAHIVRYLSPFPHAAVTGFLRIAGIDKSPPSSGTVAAQFGGSQTLFHASLLPSYERIAAFAAPAIITGALVAVLYARRQRLTRLTLFWLFVTGLYLVSLPLSLTIGASQGAHRSWAVSYAGAAMVTAAAYEFVISRRRPQLVRTFRAVYPLLPWRCYSLATTPQTRTPTNNCRGGSS